MTMINGNPNIDFLIVTKLDGFALVIERSSWRVEHAIGAYWLPHNRIPESKIAVVPLLKTAGVSLRTAVRLLRHSMGLDSRRAFPQ